MKTMKKVLIFTLILSLLIPTMTVFSSPSDEENESTQKLFFSSFEKNDRNKLLQSELDQNTISAVEACTFGSSGTNNFASLVLPTSLDGTPDGFSGEGKINLFDGNADTKFCIDQSKINSAYPVTVIFSLSVPCTLTSYSLTSANDAEARDPKNWTFYGSADGETWTALDSRTNITFSARKKSQSFSLTDNSAEYRHYKLVVTATRGADYTTKGTLLFQLADIGLFGKLGDSSEDKEEIGSSPMATLRSSGPTVSNAAYTNVGFTGASALRVYGKQSAAENTYARNVIYRDLSIKVEKNTRLSYLIYPALFTADYDYNYTSMYMAVDLAFSDGTFLSELSALDQNGFGLDPVSQGKSKSLYTMQWNYIETALGDVALGKTITRILIYFNMPQTKTASRFLTYFDDITIENRSHPVYTHPADYITILRGTNNTKSVSRGITVPLVTLPNGFNAYTPANTTDELQPYYYQQNGDACSLRHITINHSASPWLPDANWGVWQMMANTSLSLADVSSVTDIDASHRVARYTHENEIARAHYYSVIFNENDKNAPGVKMELTPTSHGAYTRFTYPADAANINLILGTDHSGSVAVQVDKEAGTTTVTGYSDYNQKMYVYSVIDAPCTAYEIHGQTVILTFEKGTTGLGMRLASSYISKTQAQKNLALEITDHDSFETVFERARTEWDTMCGKVVPEGASYTELVNLYSSLYRMHCYPLLFSENTGSAENPVWKYLSPYTGKLTDGKMYTTNGFWDTYRTVWPALSLLSPSREGEILDGLLCHYRDKGFIARWLGRGGVRCMMGTHSDIILADAFQKGIAFDYKAAYESMLKNAAVANESDVYGRAENTTAIFTGYVPNSYENGMSWTIEDYINDYGIYRMASLLAETATDPAEKARYASDAVYYKNRCQLYPTMFNEQVGYFMGKNAAGAWTKTKGEFNPYSLDWYADYAETNAWNMAFAIVYDIKGLSALYGGEEALLKKLNEFFSPDKEAARYVGGYTYEQRESRLGLSMYNNQVCLHTAYLFNYLGQPFRTQELTRDILSRHYVGSEIGQGFPGDEDNGTFSAFYVLTALGLYEASLGSGEYLISSPLYDKVTLHLESGDVTIVAHNNSDENIYIQSCKVNGKPYHKTYFTYELLTSGNLTIEYEMGNKPSEWGTDKTTAPSSLSETAVAPSPLSDLVKKGTRALSSEVKRVTPSVNTVYTDGIKNAANLWDNTSATASNLENGASLTVAFAKPTRVSFLTLTSQIAGRAPGSLTVEGSADGKTFKTLGSFSLSFPWDKYTMPFVLNESETALYFLRLSFEGGTGMTLSELELFGAPDADSDLPPVKEDTENPPVTTDTPNTTDTPTTSDSAVTQPSRLPVGAIVAIIAGILVLAGGAAAFLLLRRKKNQDK